MSTADARQLLARLIGGYRNTQMIAVAARLGLADRLADGPRGAAELAALVGAAPQPLHRLLRGLVNIGVLHEDVDGRFRLTAVGAFLRSDVSDSQRAWAIWEGDTSYRAWGELELSVRTGRTAFEAHFGRPFFEELTANEARGRQFDAAMVSFTSAIGAAVAAAYDFSPFRTVVDVGGGHGTVIAAILQAHPRPRGVLFDLPHVAAGARALLERAGVAERCRIAGGDFFQAVPRGDCYVLSHIIHDWEDGPARAILRRCREAMDGDGRLLIVEKYMPEPMVAGAVPPGTDVNMLVLTGGRERTEAEYRTLLEGAGLRLTRVIPTASMASIFEAQP
ncbi:MAG TPA: methyltransferase [Chloroflexota bacterium]|nr:methyltransferase [Chloroflexota bacterium]